MDVIATPAEPIARCKVCGDAAIVAVCHHCGAALCHDHGTNGAPGSREFRGLGLARKGRGEDPIHCADCVHRILSTGEMVILSAVGALPAVLAFALSASLPVRIGALAVVPVVVAALLVEWIGQRREEHLPRCPVVPGVENEQIVETYRYSSMLSDDGAWKHQTLEAGGSANADLRFDPDDVARVATYAGTNHGPKDLDRVDAGFVVMQLGYPAAVDAVNVTDDGDRFGGERLTFGADRVPFLFSTPGGAPGGAGAPDDAGTSGERSPSVHRWTRDYDVRLPDGPPRLPVQIFPSVAPDSDRRTLELHVRWADTDGPGDLGADRVVVGPWGRQPVSIHSLEIRAPLGRLGGALALDGDPVVTPRSELSDDGIGRIRWEQLDVADDATGTRLRVQFEHPIPSDIDIGGQVTVVFDYSLAGVTDLAWFDPLGHATFRAGASRHREPAQITSVIDVAFDFSTAHLPNEERFLRLERPLDLRPSLLQHIRPDHHTTIEIARRLTDAGFTIAHVGESTVFPAEWSVEEGRVWELRGQYFANTAALEFQLRIVGTDRRWGLTESMETAHVTSVTLAAKGDVDGHQVEAIFDAQFRAIEEHTREALIWLAAGGSPTQAAHGDRDAMSARPIGAGVDPSDDAARRPDRTVPLDALTRTGHDVPEPRRERQCSMCGLGVDHRPSSLCHHCGRLVCLERCSVTVRRDPAFVRSVDRLDTTASHCETCAEKRHQVSYRLHRVARSRTISRLRSGRR
ncbi:MAG: hypothetical protein AAGA93_17830 [Actinomycetota bacterium]